VSTRRARQLAGPSSDQLGSGVAQKGTSAMRTAAVPIEVAFAQSVVGRSGRPRVVVPYTCVCGEWHEAVARSWAPVLARTSPCRRQVILHLGLQSHER
jgi:hypothetical protein